MKIIFANERESAKLMKGSEQESQHEFDARPTRCEEASRLRERQTRCIGPSRSAARAASAFCAGCKTIGSASIHLLSYRMPEWQGCHVLFERSSRPALLTAQGREVLKLATGLLEEAERFLSAVELLREGGVRALRFGITEVAASYASAAIEAALIPRVTVFEAFGGLIPKVLEDFERGSLDVVVAPDIPADQRLIAFELISENYLIVTPKCVAEADNIPVERLLPRLDLPFVSYRHDSLDWRRSLGMIRMLGLAPRDSISLENTQAVASAVTSGFGWTILPPTSLWCVRHALDRVSVHSIGAVSIEKTLWAAAGAQRFRALALEAARVFRTRFETDWLPELLARKPELGRFVRASALPLPAA